ncbi:helix-turn-helix transcriptional regulator [Sediminispirochaeta bajacaliforniensis]|uniref:helix-turn-helix transcriptional regulator n=1 Tax=Sediminispirochaeta bajacaliforniensis TaxID=148 RepID=UPI00037B469F|nr:helix-turn-helix transcriptional regulator [Sediminispirochaeta bajacaliforniensis]
MVNNLRLWREQLGLTQLELAKTVAVTRQTIISLERGKYLPSLVLALRLARIFGCQVEDLFRLEEEICD